MKPLLRYMRQLHQRRIQTFFFEEDEDAFAQLPLLHVPRPPDRVRSWRDVELEYDSDDEGAG